MVNDAVGEIANMVVGNLKSRLADRGLNCILTIPSIVRGNNFRIEPTSCTQRRICSYQCDGDQVVVEVLLKPIPNFTFPV
jgi:chemotaxis protein CheX